MKYLILGIIGLFITSCAKSPEGIITEITRSHSDNSICFVTTHPIHDCCYGTLYVMPCTGLQVGDTLRVQVVKD